MEESKQKENMTETTRTKTPLFHTAVYINLNRSTDRKHLMETTFRSRFPNWHRVEAVDGRDLDPERSVPGITMGELGCTLSHLKAIQFAFDKGYEELLIMEDDMRIDFEDYWQTSVSQAISEAPEDADCVQLHCINASALEEMLKGTQLFRPWTEDHWSTGCYFIRRKGMEKVLQHEKKRKEKEEEEEKKGVIIRQEDKKEEEGNDGAARQKMVLKQRPETTEYRQADIYIYQRMKTYVYTRPTFNHQIQTSLIHPRHLTLHAEALKTMRHFFLALDSLPLPSPPPST
jgi:GR25 family glycosyltransferase involved in LPS biosynthesis